MSAKIFDNYFKTLDSEKLYFTQADVDQFAPARTKFDDAINNEDLTLPFQIYNVYQQRFNDRMAYARELLKGQVRLHPTKACRSTARRRPGPRTKTRRATCGASA
jgi:carboxyl-terminal processing protease